MKIPNLLIIGTQKGGTTWLHQRLGNHRDVYLSKKKELQFFDGAEIPPSRSKIEEYLAAFHEADGATYVGESTPNYFWTDLDYAWNGQAEQRKRIPEQIKSVLGDGARFILLLRHPVGRSISAYFHQFRAGRIEASESILDAGKRPLGIIDMGYYHRHWKRWTQSFQRDRFFVSTFERLVDAPQSVIEDLLAWLSLEPMQVDVAPDNSGRRDNVGFQTRGTEYGIEVLPIGKSEMHIRQYGLDATRLPRVSHDEMRELQNLFSPVYDFVSREFEIENWATDYRAEEYVDSRK